MDAETARKFYQDYIETIYHKRQVEQLGRFYTHDIVAHPAIPGVDPGLQGMKTAISSWLQAFSEMRFTVDSCIFANDTIAPRLTISAHHTGAYMGIPASGKRVNIIAHPHYRLEHGKIAEYWDLPDMLTLLQQIGVLPAPSEVASMVAWYPKTRLGFPKGKWELAMSSDGVEVPRKSARV